MDSKRKKRQSKATDTDRIERQENEMDLSRMSGTPPRSPNTSSGSFSRRRRLYHSPGVLAAMGTPVTGPAVTADAGSPMLRKVLAERETLVHRAIIRNAMTTQISSTPIKGDRIVKFGLNHSNLHRSAIMTLNDDDRVAEPKGSLFGSVSLPIPLIQHSPLRKKRRVRSMRPSIQPVNNDSGYGGATSVSETTTRDVSKRLEPFASTKRGRPNKELNWLHMVSRQIQKLTERSRQSPADLVQCRCLGVALWATKLVDPSTQSGWFKKFGERIEDLFSAIEKCPCHQGMAPDAKGRELDMRNVYNLDEDTIKSFIEWLQKSRPFLSFRLSENIKRLL